MLPWVVRTLNSSLNSLLSSAMRRLISSSSLSMESGGYFLFVLGERANSGTLWSSAPAVRKGGGRRRGKEQGGVRQVEIKDRGGERETVRERQRQRATQKELDHPRPSTFNFLNTDCCCNNGHQRAAQFNSVEAGRETALTDC